MRVQLNRIHYTDDCTLGTLSVIEGGRVLFMCATVERAWDNNKRMTSAVPAGTYKLVREYSPRFKTMLYELKGVPDRSEAKIHSANYATQLNGCIAVGQKHVDINGDGVTDVNRSKPTLAEFHKVMNGISETTIEIIGDGRDTLV